MAGWFLEFSEVFNGMFAKVVKWQGYEPPTINQPGKRDCSDGIPQMMVSNGSVFFSENHRGRPCHALS